MACSQHHRLGRSFLGCARLRVDDAHASDAPTRPGALDAQSRQSLSETKAHAHLFQSLSHCADDLRQQVRADVRTRICQDPRRSAMKCKQLDHVPHGAALVAASVKLAIAVGASTALAETV